MALITILMIIEDKLTTLKRKRDHLTSTLGEVVSGGCIWEVL